MSPIFTQSSKVSSISSPFSAPTQLSSRAFTVLASLLTLAAIATDQLLAPVFYSSSPLWAVSVGLVLTWRRKRIGTSADAEFFAFSLPRLAVFTILHVVLVAAGLRLGPQVSSFAGGVSRVGWILAGLKLSVLGPTFFLAPLGDWRAVLRNYRAEWAAALLVLLTFFPARVLAAAWPWYGQVLGRLCFALARIFVPSLSYTASLSPTLNGPDLDLTIIPACSGINGIELFDCLTVLVAILDWNRLRKGRAAFAYFGGVLAILLGNVLRISTLAVLGNRGFAAFVAHFHISAGWLFFSVVFLLYLTATYRFMLHPRESRVSPS